MCALKPCWGHIEDPCSKATAIGWGTKKSISPPSPLIIVKWIDHVIQRLSEGNCARIEIILPSPFWVSHNNLNERETYYPIWRQYARQNPHHYLAMMVQNCGWVLKVSKLWVLKKFSEAGILQGFVNVCSRPCIFYTINKTRDIPLCFIYWVY